MFLSSRNARNYSGQAIIDLVIIIIEQKTFSLVTPPSEFLFSGLLRETLLPFLFLTSVFCGYVFSFLSASKSDHSIIYIIGSLVSGFIFAFHPACISSR